MQKVYPFADAVPSTLLPCCSERLPHTDCHLRSLPTLHHLLSTALSLRAFLRLLRLWNEEGDSGALFVLLPVPRLRARVGRERGECFPFHLLRSLEGRMEAWRIRSRGKGVKGRERAR